MENKPTEFEQAAAQPRAGNIVLEFCAFLRHNKKWWLLPLLLIALLQAVLVMLAGSAAAPFIYPLF
jgi:hypothetical protein